MNSETGNKPSTVKGIFTKVLAAGVLAGAVLLATPQKAEAQQFGFSVGVGRPAYGPGYVSGYAPAYGASYEEYRVDRFHDDRFRDDRFVDERRREEFRRQEAFERQERWERDHRFEHHNPYGFGR